MTDHQPPLDQPSPAEREPARGRDVPFATAVGVQIQQAECPDLLVRRDFAYEYRTATGERILRSLDFVCMVRYAARALVGRRYIRDAEDGARLVFMVDARYPEPGEMLFAPERPDAVVHFPHLVPARNRDRLNGRGRFMFRQDFLGFSSKCAQRWPLAREAQRLPRAPGAAHRRDSIANGQLRLIAAVETHMRPVVDLLGRRMAAGDKAPYRDATLYVPMIVTNAGLRLQGKAGAGRHRPGAEPVPGVCLRLPGTFHTQERVRELNALVNAHEHNRYGWCAQDLLLSPVVLLNVGAVASTLRELIREFKALCDVDAIDFGFGQPGS